MKQQKTEQSRIQVRQMENILRRAKTLFSRKGYLATSVEEIAEAAGVNKATIYYYFHNKSDMLFVIAMETLDSLMEMADPILKSDQPAVDKLKDLIAGHIEWEVSHPWYSVGQLERRNLSPKALRTFVAARDEYESIYRKLIAHIISENRTSIDPKLATFFMMGILNSTLQWYRPSGEKSPGEVVAHAQAFIFGGLAHASVTPAPQSDDGRKHSSEASKRDQNPEEVLTAR